MSGNKALSVKENTHTHASDKRHNKTHDTVINNATDNIQSEFIYIFKSNVNIDSTTHIKILRFMGDILSMRETIFKRIKSMNNKTPF
jgi:hypothetical protein